MECINLTEKDLLKHIRELNVSEIRKIVEGYVPAAQHSLAAGFEAVQINAACGFPLSQFLSSAYN